MGTQPDAVNDPFRTDGPLIARSEIVDDRTILSQTEREIAAARSSMDGAAYDEQDVAMLDSDVTDESQEEEDPAAIRSEIEQTRAEMGETIEAIQERLQPKRLIAEAKATVREATIGKVEDVMHNVTESAQSAGSGILETIQQNPIPYALIGVGVGWLLWQARSGSAHKAQMMQHYTPNTATYRVPIDGIPYRSDADGPPALPPEYLTATRGTHGNQRPTAGNGIDTMRSKTSDIASTVHDKASDIASNVRDTTSTLASNVHDKASDMTDLVHDRASQLKQQVQTQRAQGWIQQSLNDTPLAWGVAALVAGALVGLAVPGTQQENKVLGQQRDQVMDKVQSAASATMQKVQHIAQEAVQSAQQSAKEAAKQEGLAH